MSDRYFFMANEPPDEDRPIPEIAMADASGHFPDTTLTPYEVATQLGFLFLNSTPDDALLAAAANNSLATNDGVATQVSRLLALPATTASLSCCVPA